MSSSHQRPTKTLVVTGPPGAGKATLIGALMYKCGGIDLLRLEELQKAGINSYDMVVRYHKEHCLKLYFETRHANIVVQEREVAGVPDCVLYVGSAGTTPSPVELLGEVSGSTRVVYAINKMDGVDWSEKIYTQAVEAVEGNLDEQGKSMLGVPISALYGDNILEPSAKTPWFVSGSSSPAVLVDAIDRAVMGSLGDQNMEAKWAAEATTQDHERVPYDNRLFTMAIQISKPACILEEVSDVEDQGLPIATFQPSSSAFRC